MPKSSGKPEIYLLLNAGYKPKEIIAMGYKKGSVYKYSGQMPELIKRMKEALRGVKNVGTQMRP